MATPTIVRGVPPTGRARAAELYAEAFGAKLRTVLGEGPRLRHLLAATLREDRVLCAVHEQRVVGVLGFHADGTGAFKVRHQDVAAAYSPWSAWWRLLLLTPLERHPRSGELLLDGICVDSSVRGLGIGTALLDAATELARERGATSVRLSVIDSNPRARALYERLGFEAVRTESIGPLRDMYGFESATEMVRLVPSAGCA